MLAIIGVNRLDNDRIEIGVASPQHDSNPTQTFRKGGTSVLGARALNYDTLRDTISALEFAALGLAQRNNFLVFGLMLMTFACALRRELGAGRGAVLIPTFQFLSGVGDLHSRAAAFGLRFDRLQFIAAGPALVRPAIFGR
jgi:hypothetical protein